MLGMYNPGAQSWHWVRPDTLENRPGGHTWQEDCPVVPEKVPGGQETQEVCPVVFWYWPALHPAHVTWLVMLCAVPAGHAVQLV